MPEPTNTPAPSLAELATSIAQRDYDPAATPLSSEVDWLIKAAIISRIADPSHASAKEVLSLALLTKARRSMAHLAAAEAEVIRLRGRVAEMEAAEVARARRRRPKPPQGS